MAVLVLACGCRQEEKKVSLTGEEPVEVSDFFAAFPGRKLPFVFADSLMQRKENDSLRIGLKVFTQFVPDSLLRQIFGKTQALKIYPLGKAAVPNAETYLFVKAVSGSRREGFILVFDNKNVYAAGMPAIPVERARDVQVVTMLDSKYTITRTLTLKNADGSISEGRDIYAYNADAGEFHLIMTDALGYGTGALINPIDTFPRTHKFAGDYTSGKRNIVSVRDGRKADRLLFFIHFEKNNGACMGELKGEALFRSANVAEYREGGDPCVLQFRFSASAVTLKEMEGCGVHRGLRCAFDGVYPKKKLAKAKSSAKKPRRT